MRGQNIHSKKQKHRCISGTIGALCLILLAVFFLPVLSETVLAGNTSVTQSSRTFSLPKGTTIVPKDDVSGNIQDDIWFTNTTNGIKKIEISSNYADILLKQQVRGTPIVSDEGETISLGSKSYDEYANVGYTLSFEEYKLSEDAKFSLTLSTNIYNKRYNGNLSNYVITNDDGIHRYVYWESSDTTTLYKVVYEDNSNRNSFVDFEEKFAKYCNESVTDLTVSCKDNYYFISNPNKDGDNPTVLKEALLSYISSNVTDKEFAIYKSNTTIDLKNVKRIDMITISWKRFDFKDAYENEGYWKNYEFLLSQTHSYVFGDTTKRPAAPTATAVSDFKKEADSNVLLAFKDDYLTLSDEYTGTVGTDYKLQYKLSNTDLTGRTIVDWKDYTGYIDLYNTNASYLYTRVLSNNRKSMINSAVKAYTLNYMTNLSDEVKAETYNVDCDEFIELTNNTGLILYSDSDKVSDITWTRSFEQPSNSGLTDKNFGDKISCWYDANTYKVSYIKLNNIYYTPDTSADLYFYSDNHKPNVPNTIYQSNWNLYCYYLQEGCVLGTADKLTFQLELKTKTDTPNISVVDDADASALISIEDEISISTTDTSGKVRIFYTLNGSKPSVTLTNNTLITGTNTYELQSEEKISLKDSSKLAFHYGDTVKIRALAVCYNDISDTYTKIKNDSAFVDKTYTIDCPQLENLSVKKKNGSPVSASDTLSDDELLVLTLDETAFNNTYGSYLTKNLDESMYTIKYYLSDSSVSEGEYTNLSWSTYKSSVSLSSGKNYLYVKAVPKGSGKYITKESEVVSYTWTNASNAPSVTFSLVDEENNKLDINTVEEGSLIHLSLSNDTVDGVILYTLNSSGLKLKVVDAKELPNTTISTYKDSKVAYSYIGYKNSQGIIEVDYIKVNDIWYQTPTDITVYLVGNDSNIAVSKVASTTGYLSVYATCIAEGYSVTTSSYVRYNYVLSHSVDKPEVYVSNDKSATSLKMGETITITCATENSDIFYTLNGSAPSILISENKDYNANDATSHKYILTTGDYTYSYSKNGPVVMSELLVDYGQRVTVTAQAVRFEYVGDYLVRNLKDSEVVRQTFLIEEQSAVKMVTSIPNTSSENPTTVMTGSTIYLSCATENAAIFYTLDGSEPEFNTESLTVIGTTTYKYDSSKGVTVPAASDSTLFTLTAVSCNGVARSDITKLIYQYPATVSSPYATPAAGSVTENTEVTLKTASDGAIIYYEIAYGEKTPSTPTDSSKVFDADSPIKITQQTTIKAIAIRDAMKSSVATFTYTVAEKLKTPTPSIDSGSIISAGTMVSLSADEGATIYYTIDGSDPTDANNKAVLIGSSVLIQGDEGGAVTLRTYASKTNYSNSDMGYYIYSISSYSGGIYTDKEDGSTVKNGEVIHLNTDVSDANIYYTTDGSTPTTKSSKGSSITITGEPNENVVVNAIAVTKGTEKSISFASFTYTIMNRLTAPAASVPDGAIFTKEGVVTLTAESGKIYYTTDGSEPSTTSNLYRSGISISESVQIRAIAVEDGYENSEVSSFSYGFASQVETPQASFASGELEVGTEISFYCATEGATLYYRTDGIVPDTSNTSGLQLYTGPITVDKATTFKVIAVKSKMQDSKVTTVAYTVKEPMVEEVIEEEESSRTSNTSDRLQSRRSFSDAETGPSYSDVVLKNATYGAVVSADEGILPDEVQLTVEQTQTTTAATHSVKQMVNESYGIVASYDISLLVAGEKTQPNGKVEIGIPIPADYQNSLIQIVYVGDDGTVELYDTRRSNGVAYAKVDHFSVYALAAPVDYVEKEEPLSWKTVIYFATIAGVGLSGVLLNRARKMRKEGEE